MSSSPDAPGRCAPYVPELCRPARPEEVVAAASAVRLNSGEFAGGRVVQLGANGRSRPGTLSHTGPRDTWSDGTSRHVQHHPATLRNRLKLKQVHAQSPLFPLLISLTLVGTAVRSATFRTARSLTVAFRMAWIRIIRASLTLLVDSRSASVPSANWTSRTFRPASLAFAGQPGQVPGHDPVARHGDLCLRGQGHRAHHRAFKAPSHSPGLRCTPDPGHDLGSVWFETHAA
jgi:hypothetical protein